MINRFENAELDSENAVREGQRFERHVMEGNCPINAVEELEITVPASIRARAVIGNVTLRCMGAGVITGNSDAVTGVPNAVSRFTIKQRLRVDIPVNYEMEAFVGDGHIHFDPVDVDPPASCGSA